MQRESVLLLRGGGGEATMSRDPKVSPQKRNPPGDEQGEEVSGDTGPLIIDAAQRGREPPSQTSPQKC